MAETLRFSEVFASTAVRSCRWRSASAMPFTPGASPVRTLPPALPRRPGGSDGAGRQEHAGGARGRWPEA